MRTRIGSILLLSLAVLGGCSTTRTELVPVPPRVDLSRYGALGIVDFASDADPAIGARAARRFEEQVQAAQPGTPFLELGGREAVLAAVGSRELDAEALRRIGEKYRVAALFVGELAYSRPRTDVRVTDLANLSGNVRSEMRADISARLLDTRSGASVWSSSAWAKRRIGNVSVSAQYGVHADVDNGNPREEMLPTLVYDLTGDFRPTSVRRRVQ